MTNGDKIRQDADYRNIISDAFGVDIENVEAVMQDDDSLSEYLAHVPIESCTDLPCNEFCRRNPQYTVCNSSIYTWLKEKAQ